MARNCRDDGRISGTTGRPSGTPGATRCCVGTTAWTASSRPLGHQSAAHGCRLQTRRSDRGRARCPRRDHVTRPRFSMEAGPFLCAAAITLMSGGHRDGSTASATRPGLRPWFRCRGPTRLQHPRGRPSIARREPRPAIDMQQSRATTTRGRRPLRCPRFRGRAGTARRNESARPLGRGTNCVRAHEAEREPA